MSEELKTIFGYLLLAMAIALALMIHINFGRHVVYAQAPVVAPAPAGQKIPDDIGVRIKDNQLQQTRLQNQMFQLAQQYQVAQQGIQDKTKELESLKREALEKAKLDPATNDVDVEKLVFISKAPPPAPNPPEKK
jgi:hypothetical protein